MKKWNAKDMKGPSSTGVHLSWSVHLWSFMNDRIERSIGPLICAHLAMENGADVDAGDCRPLSPTMYQSKDTWTKAFSGFWLANIVLLLSRGCWLLPSYPCLSGLGLKLTHCEEFLQSQAVHAPLIFLYPKDGMMQKGLCFVRIVSLVSGDFAVTFTK